MRCVLSVGGVFLALAFTASAGDIDAKNIVGKWRMTKGEEVGTIEFAKDGKMHVTVSKGGKEIKFGGTYEIQKNKLGVTYEKDGAKKTEFATIHKLTTDTLVVQGDDDKEKMEFKRIKD